MRTVDYLDAAKRAARLPSDYALAMRLGSSRQRISNWRVGRSVPEPLECYKLAELCGVDPIKVLADLELERAEKAENQEHASAWREILGKLGGAAAMVTLAVGLNVSASSPAGAATSRHEFDNNAHSRNSRRRRLLASIDRMLHGMHPAPAL